MSEGFFFDELSEFKKDLMREVKELFPKETEKFLKDEAKKLTKKQRQIAKQEVKSTGKGGDKSYHKKFKVGKIYTYDGDKCVRSYNGSPHAHLIENGHKTQNGKFVQGRYILKISQNEFKTEFAKDCDRFLGEYFDEVGK